MATIITSLGAGTSHSESVVINNVSGSGPTYTVTLSTSVPSSVVIGDAFFDEAATPNKYLIEGISGSDLTVRDSTGVSAAPDDTSGSSTPNITRYYNGSTPITDWESELDDTDLYDAGDDADGQMYDDADFDEQVVFNGGGTIGLNSVTLGAASGEEPLGVENGGVRLLSSSDVVTIFECDIAITLHDIEIDMDGNRPASINGIVHFDVDGGIGNRLMVHNSSGSLATMIGIRLSSASTLNNCMVYDIHNTSTASFRSCKGIWNDTNANANVYHCTVHDITLGSTDGNSECYGIGTASFSGQDIRGCVVTDVTAGGSVDVACIDGGVTKDGNVTTDGTGDVTGVDSADQYVSNSSPYDLLLKSGADAIDAATDLGTVTAAVDILLRNRDTEGDTWDSGAHELAASVITGASILNLSGAFTSLGVLDIAGFGVLNSILNLSSNLSTTPESVSISSTKDIFSSFIESRIFNGNFR